MRIIKLNATDSTNRFLRNLSLDSPVEDFTTIVTDDQTQGRGQMGTSWQSQPFKNLTFSVYKRFDGLLLEQQFNISMAVSLAIIKALETLNIPKLSVKWPNDILSDNQKICGVLIENVIKQNHIESSIIGIGLNVNQLQFEHFPKASSLKKITGVSYHLDEVLHLVLKQLQIEFKNFNKDNSLLKASYESYLFRKEKPSTFKSAEGLFSGIIKGVSNEGLLEVLIEDQVLKTFDLKTITLLY
ncbi:biotin--[acetyl-CoA-carboxylase] ligase [Olleya aquimaris]|uniref:BirA family biotin operon repressor/biotin-[acetyl-CoA-carboxylase] ligase n=1 Tax=Olleya aquimaris TaxID=639310 RepID=A0A327RDD4_9FLAO|nr:biotin--[acetyl-CoA-carboxylase] ligase [Olleya aquimaris]RAJ13473.1 BirA family biotin operon repressor/biotin-[acetyl-CoA-carboxylase] ligase [Olleya aquimaris]